MNNGERRNKGDFRDIKYYTIEIGAASEGVQRGKRVENQDSHSEFSCGNLAGVIVSDGIGGHRGGAEAARLVTDAGRETAERMPKTESLANILANMIETGDMDIRDGQNHNPNHNQMGATFAGLLIRNGEMACANVGDTRIYRKRKNILWQLSVDHTEAEEFKQKKALQGEEATAEELAQRQNILKQAAGYGPEAMEPNLQTQPVEIGDIYLLVSDGLYTKLTNNELFDLIDERDLAETIARKIMAAAKERGLTDDATVVAVKVK